MKKISIFVLRLYKKVLSPILTMFLGHACRFTPSCSEYSIQALDAYGFWKGTLMSLKRISKCNPLSKPGYDPLI